MKILKHIIIIAVVLTVIFILSGIVISLTYEDTAISYLKKYLDKHLITEIEVDEINFSLLKNFPNASVEFKNINAKSTLNFSAKDFTGTDTETLLTAKSIFFEFGLIKLLSGNYIVRNIHIKNGKLIALIDKSGKCNYNIWIQEAKSASSSLRIDLQSLVFTDLELNIINLKEKYSLGVFSNKTTLSGDLSNSLNKLSARGNLNIYNFRMKNNNVIRNKVFDIQSNLVYDKTNFRILNGQIKYDNMVFTIEGNYKQGTYPEINLVVSSDRARIAKLLIHFPDFLKSLRKEFSLNGNISFRTSVNGTISANHNPHISTEFKISNGAVTNINTRDKLSGINLTGIYSNGKNNNAVTSSVSIKEFITSTRNNRLKGNLNIRNFDTPTIKLSMSGILSLEDIHKLIGIDTLEYINGIVSTVIKLEGKLSGMRKITGKDFTGLNKKCTLNINNADFRLSGNKTDYNNINGEIIIEDKVRFNNVSFNVGDNDFLISGIFNNLFEYMFLGDNYLSFNTSINSTSVNAESILAGQSKITGRKQNSGKLSPDKIYFNSSLSLEKFKFKKFIASDVSGTINYTPEIITLKSFHFHSFNGIIKGEGIIIRQKDNFIVQCQSVLESINIKELFYSFNNFGQDFIIDKNLGGELSGRIGFSAMWDNNYNMIGESINADCDINIRNGELMDFEPLMGLSKFIAVDELQHVEFKTLNNEILIKDKTIIIPEMDIYSSAFNISALGIHKFDNSYDYRITVSLSDLLFKKAKRKKKEIGEFGIIEDDGMGKISIPIRFTGKDNNYKSIFDRQSALDALKQNISDEKKTVKKIIREEFNISDKNAGSAEDSIGNKHVNIMQEEENNKKDAIFAPRNRKEDDKPDFIIQWDEDTLENRNE
jgi:hypothetical protein